MKLSFKNGPKNCILSGKPFPPAQIARTAIVVLNYQHIDDTKNLIKSLECSTDQDFDLYVVDNCSVNLTVSDIVTALPKAHILRTETNLGYAGGNNAALRLIENLPYEFVWLLNPDTEVDPWTLPQHVKAALDYPEYSIFGPVLLNGANPPCISSAGLHCKFNDGLDIGRQYANEPTENLPDSPFESDFVSGCAIFFRKDILSEIGYLPEDYFLYCEEVEWLITAASKGFPSLTLPHVFVTHHQRSWGDGIPETYYFYYNIRASLLFWQRMGLPDIDKVISRLKRKFIRGWLKKIATIEPEKVGFFEALTNRAILAGLAGQTGKIELESLEDVLHVESAMSENSEYGKMSVAETRASKDKAPRTRNALLILGMHRSGTSALAGVFSKLGCDLPKSKIGCKSDNAKGFFESSEIARMNDDLLQSAGSSWDDWMTIGQGWYESVRADEFRREAAALLESEFGESRLFVLKDPRVCRLVPFWSETLAQENCKPLAVHIHRNPLEVAASLQERNKIPKDLGMLIWLGHVLEAEAGSRGMARYFTSYDKLMNNWPEVAMGSQDSLGISLPRLSARSAREIDAFLTPDLRHFTQVPEQVLRNPMISRWIRDTYEIFERWAANGEDESDHAALNRIRNEVSAAAPAFAMLVTETREELSGLRNKLNTAEKALDEEKVARETAEQASVRLEETLTTEKQNRTTIETELTDLKASFEKMCQDREVEIARSEKQSHALEAARTELQSLRDSLNQAESALAQRSHESQQVGKELAKAKAELSESYAENEALKAQNEQLKQQANELAKLTQVAQETEAALQAEQEERSKLEEQLAELNSLRKADIKQHRQAEGTHATEMAQLTQILQDRDRELAEAHNKIASNKLEQRRLSERLSGTQRALDKAEGKVNHEKSRADHFEFAVMCLQSSTSWRLTAPIRFFAGLLQRRS